ncbi:MAG: prepilin-type N-terminal cleavage/methylation domain-containing protein [bacterium]
MNTQEIKYSVNEGFTLIELMIAVAIMAVLCGLSINLYTGFRQRAMAAQVYANCDAILTSIRCLEVDTGFWPGHTPAGTFSSPQNEIEDLRIGRAGLLIDDPADPYPDWAGPYIDKIYPDPWGNNYFYDSDYYINGKKVVVVGSYGPNGEGCNKYDEDDIYVILSTD